MAASMTGSDFSVYHSLNESVAVSELVCSKDVDLHL